MKKVFLFSGKISSGKNQFADFVSDVYKKKGLKVVSDLFAKDLKDWSKVDFRGASDVLNNIASLMKKEIVNIQNNQKSYGIADDGATSKLLTLISSLNVKDENWYENKTDITRSLLQIYGTQIFRNRVDDLYWIKRTKKRITECNTDIVLITDVRFPNEVDFISNSDEYETYAVRINRDIKRTGKQHEHISETALDNYKEFAYTIENKARLSELKDSAYALIDDIEKDGNL